MARPKKYRKICKEPECNEFNTKESKDVKGKNMINLTLEEFEVIRLIDYEQLDQTQSSEKMGVARSTIQRVYKEAREKIADFLINGKCIKIKGGQYELCKRFTDGEECLECVEEIRNRGL